MKVRRCQTSLGYFEDFQSQAPALTSGREQGRLCGYQFLGSWYAAAGFEPSLPTFTDSACSPVPTTIHPVVKHHSMFIFFRCCDLRFRISCKTCPSA